MRTVQDGGILMKITFLPSGRTERISFPTEISPFGYPRAIHTIIARHTIEAVAAVLARTCDDPDSVHAEMNTETGAFSLRFRHQGETQTISSGTSTLVRRVGEEMTRLTANEAAFGDTDHE